MCKMRKVKSFTKAFLFLTLSFICIPAYSQVEGRVVNRNEQPIEFANVFLLNAKDSTVVDAAVTDSLGNFRISQPVQSGLLKVSCIGYETNYINYHNGNGKIKLEEDAKTIGEVEVKAKAIRRAHDGLIVNVSETTLGKLGDASDVLKHLPLVVAKGDAYEVLGKGTPIIYINNRLVQDNNELAQLNASDIQQVKVITHPGAEYDATVSAVIRIKTKKAQGDGFGGLVRVRGHLERRLCHSANYKLAYSHKGFELFSSFQYYRNYDFAQQVTTHTYNTRRNEDSGEQVGMDTRLDGTFGINYQLGDKFSSGVMYTYSDIPSGKFIISDHSLAYNNEQLVNDIYSHDSRDYTSNNHHVNGYLNYDFSNESHLKLDFDIVKKNSEDSQQYLIENGHLENINEGKTELYAGKLTFEHPLWGGSVSAGGQFSRTFNNNDYRVEDATIKNALSNCRNKAHQNLYAYFLEYQHPFGKYLTAKAGARYEHVDFDYFIGDVKSEEASKVYSDFYPSASLSYNTDDWQLDLYYRNTTSRPSYHTLRNSTAMNGLYSYEGGNPRLQPMRANSVGLSAGWKDLSVDVSYRWNHNAILYVLGSYNNIDSICYFHTENVNKSQVLDVTLSYTPTLFKIWKPNLSVDWCKNYLTYNGQTYNKPVWNFSLYNTLELPKSWVIGLDVDYNTSGNGQVSYYYSDTNVDLYCLKTMLKDKLSLKFMISNLFNSSRERWDKNSNGYHLEKWNDSGRRTFSLIAIYKFNQSKNKYKGSVSSDEIKRL